MFEELKSYVDFGAADEQALRRLHGLAAPHFPRIVDVFYERIFHHSEARKALEGGESQVGRLKVTLRAWLDSLLTGPWDAVYYERRARIGRAHVRIGLPQHYMFGAMNLMRQQLNALIDGSLLTDPKELAAARVAVGKILDIELAIMLHTYREDLLSQQSKAERLSTFGQLVGSIGHELRNPLGVIETSLYILKGRVPDDERARKHIARITQQVDLANGIITQLLDMIRDRPLARQTVKLGDVVAQSNGAVTRPAEVGLQILGVDELPAVSGDPLQLRQVFVNLLENAVHASSPQGEVRVVGSRNDGHVQIAVEDTGPGVDRSIRARLFEPLVTTKAKGIGLGLSLVKRIVERHGGTIGYQDGAKGGARFVVQLPVRA